MDDPAVEFQSVSFRYGGGAPVLREASFVLRGDQRVALIGHNGSGKTTLFHILTGLLSPDSGSLRVFGRTVGSEEDFFFVRERVGYLFQNSDDQLFCPTVREDVAFGPLNLGKSPDEARRIVRETLSLLGMERFENRASYRLSHGEKKLVALAAVLAMSPRVLLLDEPTAGLDRDTTERIAGVLLGLGLPAIVASHDFDFLERVTGESWILADGRVVPAAEDVLHAHSHAHRAGSRPHHHSDLEQG
jgi:cobalt/nickel transport system ATP-binding protein